MFTGIITNLGAVKKKTASRLNIQADAGLINRLDLGGSVAVNGVCLTVAKVFPKAGFEVDVMPETFKKTVLGALFPGAGVNLELPLAATGRFDGHIVQGHVDGTATVKSIEPSGNSRLLTFLAPKKLLDYMVEKGSVTVSGISLTIIDVTDKTFSAGIIPRTWQHTNLKSAKVGDKVNVELDILAKYIYKFIKLNIKQI